MSNFQCLKINHLFNHQIFLDNYSGYFINALPHGGLAGCYLSPTSFQFSGSKIVNDIPFSVSEPTLDTNDNISCEEQICDSIYVTCSEIHLLGLAEHGNFEDKIKLIFTDGDFSEVDFFMYDWRNRHTIWEYEKKNNCRIALEGKDNLEDKGYIYSSSSIILESTKPLKALIFPYNPNIHIFAATLKFLQ